MLEKAKGSIEVQTFLVAELRRNTNNVDHQSREFKRDVQMWAAVQIVKVFNTLAPFSSVGN